MAFRRKVYGESRIDHCSFCGKIATQKNATGALVCYQHIQTQLDDVRCTCGLWLEQRSGKFGHYFHCRNCGNINFNKAMEMKKVMGDQTSQIKEVAPQIRPKENISQKIRFVPKETIISTKDVEYFD